MNINDYQNQAVSTAIYPEEAGVFYPALGLAGEVGEVAAKVAATMVMPTCLGDDQMFESLKDVAAVGEECERLKKQIRGRAIPVSPKVVMTESEREGLKLELGDALWYIAATAKDLGLTLEEVAQGNLDKLASRQRRGVIHGEGDNR